MSMAANDNSFPQGLQSVLVIHSNTGLPAIRLHTLLGSMPAAGATVPKRTWADWAVPVAVLLISIGSVVATIVHARNTVLATSPDIRLEFPMSIEAVQRMEGDLRKLAASQWEITVAYCTLYTFLQAFSIPGSFVMNLVGGVLLGSAVGVPLIAVLTTIGSLLCYCMSWVFGGPLLQYFGVKDKLDAFGRRIKRAEAEGTLFFYLMTVRAFPMSPHWFLNCAAPWVGISPLYFAPTILIGKMPYVWAIVAAGEIVSTIKPGDSIIPLEDQLKLAAMALLMSTPALLMRFCSKNKVSTPWELLFGDEEPGAAAKSD